MLGQVVLAWTILDQKVQTLGTPVNPIGGVNLSFTLLYHSYWQRQERAGQLPGPRALFGRTTVVVLQCPPTTLQY